ncbi:hypothetical protein INT45_008960 [Circinella minor]|uniref:Uncharacterized protein n=1 Tax=Circinella minor TaxID=1195481 RepID=A0A8H7S5A4_9FUNG|nr:hypothetical protein INT45_008960 [Circinella minor]
MVILNGSGCDHIQEILKEKGIPIQEASTVNFFEKKRELESVSWKLGSGLRFEEEDDEEEKVVGTKDAKKPRTFVPTKVKFEGEAGSSKEEKCYDGELEVFPPGLQ